MLLRFFRHTQWVAQEGLQTSSSTYDSSVHTECISNGEKINDLHLVESDPKMLLHCTFVALCAGQRAFLPCSLYMISQLFCDNCEVRVEVCSMNFWKFFSQRILHKLQITSVVLSKWILGLFILHICTAIFKVRSNFLTFSSLITEGPYIRHNWWGIQLSWTIYICIQWQLNFYWNKHGWNCVHRQQSLLYEYVSYIVSLSVTTSII